MSIAKFNTFLDITRKEAYDKKHWINVENSKYLKKKFYDKIIPNVTHCPDFISNKKIICSNCGKTCSPNFLEKHPPILPMILNNEIYQPQQLQLKCDKCNYYFDYAFEMAKFTDKTYAFGDESYRDTSDGKMIISFSIVSSFGEVETKRLKNEFDEIKYAFINTDPDNWILHLTEIWGQNDRKNGLFKNLQKSDVQQLCKSMSEYLLRNKQHLYLYNSTGVFHKPTHCKKNEIKKMKELVYYPLLMRLFHEHTKNGLSPHLFFEADGNDGWAKNLFLGGRVTALWPILTHGVPIKSPEYVPKDYDFRLQIADFMSFIIARYLFLIDKKSRGELVGEIDVDPEWLGDVRYLGYDDKGNCFLKTESKYPLKCFFKNTCWDN